MPVDKKTGEIVGNFSSMVVIDHPAGRPGRRVRLFIDPEEKMTKESLDIEHDINKIMANAQRGVFSTHFANRVPFFGDVSQVPDYKGALDIIFKVQEDFNSLPSNIRSRFDNDPQKMLDFLSDPKNLKEAGELGMLKNKDLTGEPGPTPPLVPPAPPPAK